MSKNKLYVELRKKGIKLKARKRIGGLNGDGKRHWIPDEKKVEISRLHHLGVSHKAISEIVGVSYASAVCYRNHIQPPKIEMKATITRRQKLSLWSRFKRWLLG